ncbi:piggyBac transposable element-derived protein 4-like [Pararge aegeria]|uniref:piggyBac transposable element-derived protein 4-like n=1 Tax=Pararge aegeria TaxID=116150 RepID=UPI0019D191EC|nr:piggyBac transposable element-derived protein 4-like [Pararge aegeria]XP_039757352.1 piggyBac transposable element-derived protein 4-like [Pararge aegeria]
MSDFSDSDSDYQPPPLWDGSNSTSSDSCLSQDDVSLLHESTPVPPEPPRPDWHQPNGSRQKRFPLDIQPGINISNNCNRELDIFRLFLNQDIMDLMVQMTNCYANKVKILKVVTRNMRLAKWTDCTEEEILKFLGLLIFMGLNKLPKISDYWSNKKLYKNEIARQAMSRNRFELLLRCWHFEDSFFHASNTDRLIKIRRLVQLLTATFRNAKTPGEYITVDETMVAFRGRIKFMQYIPGKRHKYGIKLFKVCDDDGYTYDLIVYEGKNSSGQTNTPTNLVMKLCQPYLGVGRSVVTDNYYTSVDLAQQLLQNDTHLIGTLRRNRKGLPKKVVQEKLNKGEMIALENNDGILILKWKDKRDVLALSTKHSVGFVTVTSKRNRNKKVMKPTLIADYNKHKCSIDLSDQMASYANPARRTIRWFQKLAIELLFSTAVTNAFIIYKTHKQLSSKKYTITDFRENLCLQMLGITSSSNSVGSLPRRQIQHKFSKSTLTDHRGRLIRRRCIHCYKKNRDAGLSAKEARDQTKKVNTVCLECPTKPSVCGQCYAEIHIQINP